MERAAKLVAFLQMKVVKDQRITLDLETPLVSSGLVDSLSLLQVLAFVEDEFGVSIPDEAATAESMNTVGQLMALVDEYANGR